MMHSALSIRSSGMLSGISMISLSTDPQFSRRSVSLISFAAETGRAINASASREENIRLITVHLFISYLGQIIIECPVAGRNHGPWKRTYCSSSLHQYDASQTEDVAFRLYFSQTILA